MDLEKHRRTILNEVIEQITEGNRALEDMRRKTKSIIEHESKIEEALRENTSLRSGAEEEFKNLLEMENELYELQLEAQEKLIEIQTMRLKLESKVKKSYPKYKILSDRMERSQSEYETICSQENNHRKKLECEIREYNRLRSEAELINKLKKTF